MMENVPRLANLRSAARRAGVAAALAACAPGAAAQAALTLPAQDRALRADGTAVFTVAPAAGAQPVAAAFDGSENLYVLDRGRGVVVVYDGAGRELRRLGRPGEMASPVAVAVAADGTVVVLDVARGLLAYAPDGRLGATLHVPGLDSHDTRGVLYAHPRGGVVVAARPAGADRAPRQDPLRTSTALAWYRLDGSAPRELRVARAQAEAVPGDVQSSGTGGGMRMNAPLRPVFAPEVRWAVLSDGGLAVAESETYRLALAAPGGGVRLLRRALQPRRVTPADRERFLGRRAPGAGATAPAGGSMTLQIDPGAIPFAPVMPVIQRVAADPAGRLWIQRAGPVWGEDGPIDVLRADGSYLGTLAASPMPAAVSRGGLAAYLAPATGRVEVRRLPSALR
jgi:hypothetical protein